MASSGFEFEDDLPDDPSSQGLNDRLDAMRAKIEELRARIIRSIRDKAGDRYSVMLGSRQATESYLDHPDPNMRLAAIQMFGCHWRYDERFAEACERMARTDPDDQVRALAISALGSYYEDTSDSMIGRLLAEVVHDDAQETSVRKNAYLSLWQISGRSLLDRPSRGSFRFPEDVDWVLVGVFLLEG